MMKKLIIIGITALALAGTSIGIVIARAGSGDPQRLPDTVQTTQTQAYAATFGPPTTGISSIGFDAAYQAASAGFGATSTDSATSVEVIYGTFLPPTTGVGMVAVSTPGYVVVFQHACLQMVEVPGCAYVPMAIYVDAVTGRILGDSTISTTSDSASA